MPQTNPLDDQSIRAYRRIKSDIQAAIAEIRKSDPAMADYLTANIVFNDTRLTAQYVGEACWNTGIFPQETLSGEPDVP